MFGPDFTWRLMWLPISILSLSFHEFAHAWSAWRLGDDTASSEGRLTLNPLSHIDLLGTILLPLFSPIPFGWAKPVPVDPARFRRDVNMSTGMAITAAAGPLSNVLLAVVAAVLLGLGVRFAPDQVALDSPARFFLVAMVQMNVGLAIFNLIPLPPLDGSRVVAWLLPYRLQQQWHQLESFAPFLLVAVFMFGGRLVRGPINDVIDLLLGLARALAFA
ncbi:MAG: site-2 protease family protein [Anaeromyxobacteraceae bacterium]|nr:site-2 protease family protein [Anaeromyxobacteraceae bacterium]